MVVLSVFGPVRVCMLIVSLVKSLGLPAVTWPAGPRQAVGCGWGVTRVTVSVTHYLILLATSYLLASLSYRITLHIKSVNFIL